MRGSAVPVLAGLLLAAGCGGKGVTVTQPPTPVVSAPATTPVPSPTAARTPRAGVPTSFPADVPLVGGHVQNGQPSSTGGADTGWQVDVTRHGSARDCFEAARASLLARGFEQQAIVGSGGEKQAQFTSGRYAVILTAHALPGGKCSAHYTVGAFGG
jgi:hypothetical protein